MLVLCKNGLSKRKDALCICVCVCVHVCVIQMDHREVNMNMMIADFPSS